MIYLITGKKGAGKTHYAETYAKELRTEGKLVKVIDGDIFRADTKNNDFSDAGRFKNLIEAALLARQYEREGFIVFLSFVSPKQEWREMMRRYWKESKVVYLPGGTLWQGTEYERPMNQFRKHWRKIKVKVLAIQGLVYRVFIIGCAFLFFLLLTKDMEAAFKISIGWSAVNMILYYGFHYVWAKRFKVGKE